MSLELKIEALTTAINALTAALTQRPAVAPAPVAAPVPVPPPAPVSQPAPAPVVPPPAPIMPPPPSFAAPAPTPSPAGAPFSDPKGLMDYVMTRYKALGSEKGALIHQVLLTLGVQNINDVRPDQYAALYAGVEGIK